MNDQKQNADNEIVDLDTIAEESLEDLELQENFDEQAEDFDGFEQEDLTPAKKKSSGSPRFWLVLAILGFILALLSNLILQPAISVQKQRASFAAQAISQVNLTNAAASQALTESGQYGPIGPNLAAIEAPMQSLTSGSSLGGKIAGVLFANGDLNRQATTEYEAYKAAVNTFKANEEGK